MREENCYESSSRGSWYRGFLLKKLDWWYYLRIVALVLWAWVLLNFKKSKKLLIQTRAFKTLRLTEDSGTAVRIENFQNIRAIKGPAVFTANHMSMLETFILPTLLVREFNEVSPVVKKSLTEYPFFGPILNIMDPIRVRRKNAREDLRTVMKEGIAALKEGRSVVIFPQATRSEGFEPSSFNSLGVKLASRAGVPLVPVALKTDFYGIGRRFRDFGPLRRDRKVYFRFGQAREVTDEKTAHKEVVNFIVESLHEWGLQTGSELQNG